MIELVETFFEKDKALRHYIQHFMFALMFSILAMIIAGEISFPLLGIAITGVLVPDIDHLITMVIFWKRFEKFYTPIVDYIFEGNIKAAMEFASRHHKTIDRMLVHNFVSLTLLLIAGYFVITSESSYLIYFYFGFMAHLIMDLLNDFNQVGNANNWLWRTSSHQIP